MSAYYNEIDPYAAKWLRNLIAAGHIAPGDVDERSIEDVSPDDLRGYTQCHFFAGIGVWSYALRLAGWPDDRPVWTGSCPCQPFSAAGAQAGFADERHLWPAFYHLIEQCAPPVLFGEQVASKAAEPWLDLVQADLEAVGYAFGALPFPSAGVGAPHIRDRLFWVGHSDDPGLEGYARHGRAAGRQGAGGSVAPAGVSGRLADNTERGRREECQDGGGLYEGDRTEGVAAGSVSSGTNGRLADAPSSGRQRWGASKKGDGADATRVESERLCEAGRLADASDSARQPGKPGTGERGLPASDVCCEGRTAAGPTNGFWRVADWIFCRDGKWRPVEPGTFPLAHGAPARVGRLRAYGNAINAEAAREFITAYLETEFLL